MPSPASGETADRSRASSALGGTGPSVPPSRTAERDATTAACTEAGSEPDGPRVLVFTTLFPNDLQPTRGVFVRDRVTAVAQHCPTRVVAPLLSRFGLRRLERGPVRAVPFTERQNELYVYHPRFNTLPGLGRCVDGTLLFAQTLSYVRRLRTEFLFDLIDAHYAFPDGTAATLLGQRLGVPVSVTLRGGDVDLLPHFRLRRRMIRRTLERADHIFAVSEHVARGAERLGIARNRIQVVANGIDPLKFFPLNRTAARHSLGIADHARLILCVGNLVAEKGHHVLIEALARMKGLGSEPPRLVIIGTDQRAKRAYQQQIERRVAKLRLADRVSLLGSKHQSELIAWYCAADVLALPTFREGSPNVIREALACGVPVVASQVGGVPELLTSEALGLMVQPGDVDGLAGAIDEALNRRWDRPAIAAAAPQPTWASVGLIIANEFKSLVQP